MNGEILGLHHITLVSADAARTADFYTQLLGLRMVKKTVNFDDPSSYHLYFGDDTGSAASIITFFEWKDARRGRTGVGGTHHVAFRTANHDSLLRWKRRLSDAGLRVAGPYDRESFVSIYFRDPDGAILEIATEGPGNYGGERNAGDADAQLEPPSALARGGRNEAGIAALTWPDAVKEIDDGMSLKRGMHHITAMSSNLELTDQFFRGVLGLSMVKKTMNFDEPDKRHWIWGTADARVGSLVTYLERPASERRATMGAGQTHHFALAVGDDDTQLAFRDRLLDANIRVSPVMDRIYFKSIYTQDPDGHVVELATVSPGFLVDESADQLGSALMLPPWLEPHRAEIAPTLASLETSSLAG